MNNLTIIIGIRPIMMQNKNTSIILIYLKGEKREGSKPK